MILSAAHSSSTSAVRVISRRQKACQLRRRLADFCREGEWTARRLERRGRQERYLARRSRLCMDCGKGVPRETGESLRMAIPELYKVRCCSRFRIHQGREFRKSTQRSQRKGVPMRTPLVGRDVVEFSSCWISSARAIRAAPSLAGRI